VRGFLIGIVLVTALTATILSVRPGGLRQQMRFAARRFRIALALGGIYVVASLVIRLAFPSGPVSDFGPAAVAVVLCVAFLVAGRDPIRQAGQPAADPRKGGDPRGPHAGSN
jgi:hypothetical protein